MYSCNCLIHLACQLFELMPSHNNVFCAWMGRPSLIPLTKYFTRILKNLTIKSDTFIQDVDRRCESTHFIVDSNYRYSNPFSCMYVISYLSQTYLHLCTDCSADHIQPLTFNQIHSFDLCHGGQRRLWNSLKVASVFSRFFRCNFRGKMNVP